MKVDGKISITSTIIYVSWTLCPWNETLQQHIAVSLGDDLWSKNNLTLPPSFQMCTLCGSSSLKANKKDSFSSKGWWVLNWFNPTEHQGLRMHVVVDFSSCLRSKWTRSNSSRQTAQCMVLLYHSNIRHNINLTINYQFWKGWTNVKGTMRKPKFSCTSLLQRILHICLFRVALMYVAI